MTDGRALQDIAGLATSVAFALAGWRWRAASEASLREKLPDDWHLRTATNPLSASLTPDRRRYRQQLLVAFIAVTASFAAVDTARETLLRQLFTCALLALAVVVAQVAMGSAVARMYKRATGTVVELGPVATRAAYVTALAVSWFGFFCACSFAGAFVANN